METSINNPTHSHVLLHFGQFDITNEKYWKQHLNKRSLWQRCTLVPVNALIIIIYRRAFSHEFTERNGKRGKFIEYTKDSIRQFFSDGRCGVGSEYSDNSGGELRHKNVFFFTTNILQIYVCSKLKIINCWILTEIAKSSLQHFNSLCLVFGFVINFILNRKYIENKEKRQNIDVMMWCVDIQP